MLLSRATLQALARSKLDDARLLLANNRVSNAYYLAGYALELGFKAAACQQFLPECIPDKSLVRDLYDNGHDLNRLAKLAGLETQRADEAAADPLFAANWSTVSQWSVSSRYEMMDEFRAVEMVNAVGDAQHGVLQWLEKHW
ncbi:hypothetical protein [Brevundimonas sp.]|jgi:hypothetical protein|uniref:hypothetical protein n=1 Tax=Brevundimonas sp. TaxID=1871086 RepID=UPI00391D1819